MAESFEISEISSREQVWKGGNRTGITRVVESGEESARHGEASQFLGGYARWNSGGISGGMIRLCYMTKSKTTLRCLIPASMSNQP